MILQALKSPIAQLIAMSETMRISKSLQWSEEERAGGNELFMRKNHTQMMHEEIWRKYTWAISMAPMGCEQQALAYGNRSSLLLHWDKYKECNRDIDRAIAITKSAGFKVKLLCRKVKCLVALDLPEKVTFEGAQYWLDQIEDTDKNKESYVKVLDKTNGRHVIATKDIRPGEVIFVENPYVTVLMNLLHVHAYCGHCLGKCWDMIPCDLCAWCMICSEKCKKEAY